MNRLMVLLFCAIQLYALEISGYQQKNGDLYIKLKNNSKSQIAIWDMKYSWGYSNLWLEIKSKNGSIDTVRKCAIDYGKNIKGRAFIPSSGVFEIRIPRFELLNEWSYVNKGGSFDSIRFHYESGFEKENDDHYWIGRGKLDLRKVIWKGYVKSDWVSFKDRRGWEGRSECSEILPFFKSNWWVKWD